jgi:hypothetical protein
VTAFFIGYKELPRFTCVSVITVVVGGMNADTADGDTDTAVHVPRLHAKEPRNAFVMNQSEKEEGDQDEDRNDDDEYYTALEKFEGNEELEKTLPDKHIEQCIPDTEGHYSEEQVKLIAKDLYRIDCSDGRIIFEEKMPERMYDGKKWKRTDLGFFVDGSLSSCAAKKPETIKGKSHATENRRKGSFPNLCNRGEQLITRAFKVKYGYVPQFHAELANYTTSVFGKRCKIFVGNCVINPVFAVQMKPIIHPMSKMCKQVQLNL